MGIRIGGWGADCPFGSCEARWREGWLKGWLLGVAVGGLIGLVLGVIVA